MIKTETYTQQMKSIISMHIHTVLLLFVIFISLGMLMRFNQAVDGVITPLSFYGVITMHGLGMTGIFFIGGLTAVTYLLAKYIHPSIAVLKLVYWLIALAVAGLFISTLYGQFGPGWYLLYPLPFIHTWPSWSIGLAIISLMILGAAWLIWQLELLRAMAVQYGLSNLLGWQYFKKEKYTEIPAIVLITTICVLSGILALISDAIVLMVFIYQWLEPSLNFDALFLKNAGLFFGHTLVNITMYLGIAIVYDMMPSFSGRSWHTDKVIVAAWNATFIYILLAYFHHLYMDFAQPIGVQYLGQIMSYLSTVPATGITVFGAFTQVYRSGIKWTFVPLCFYFGFMGWVIGGIAALIDSTIMVNFHFHNTLWIPAHFHTYYLLGYVLILLGFIYHFKNSKTELFAKLSLFMMMLGGYGFVLMFYIAGVSGVPRRYAIYSAIPIHSVADIGRDTATFAFFFLFAFIMGLLMYYSSIFLKQKNS
ncbi:MAG: cbb3-type cytochrome c oxidase subunit I [Gammaproteobacteria bacterium]|nr:cbb3-type cytochrome c oxidase subunit I [Gammaproteobacteria bacterium]MCW5583690.1 cbb3-type cytochrome c oxidase subunit I [Gammaproteobacteria bacterium]